MTARSLNLAPSTRLGPYEITAPVGAGKLKKIDASGGAAVAICEAPDGRGGTWNREGVILFAPETQAGLSKVPAGGGAPTPVTKLDRARHETTHRLPGPW